MRQEENMKDDVCFDKRVGQNIARFRMKMPQQELADEMRKRGFKWSQATVWATERGERPVRLSEGVALSEILDRPYDAFFVEEKESDLVDEVRTQKKIMELSRESLKQSIVTWMRKRQSDAIQSLILRGREYSGLPERTQAQLSADLDSLEFYAIKDSFTDMCEEAEAEFSASDLRQRRDKRDRVERKARMRELMG